MTKYQNKGNFRKKRKFKESLRPDEDMKLKSEILSTKLVKCIKFYKKQGLSKPGKLSCMIETAACVNLSWINHLQVLQKHVHCSVLFNATSFKVNLIPSRARTNWVGCSIYGGVVVQ